MVPNERIRPITLLKTIMKKFTLYVFNCSLSLKKTMKNSTKSKMGSARKIQDMIPSKLLKKA
jgi:hypothetical protein